MSHGTTHTSVSYDTPAVTPHDLLDLIWVISIHCEIIKHVHKNYEEKQIYVLFAVTSPLDIVLKLSKWRSQKNLLHCTRHHFNSISLTHSGISNGKLHVKHISMILWHRIRGQLPGTWCWQSRPNLSQLLDSHTSKKECVWRWIYSKPIAQLFFFFLYTYIYKYIFSALNQTQPPEKLTFSSQHGSNRPQYHKIVFFQIYFVQ